MDSGGPVNAALLLSCFMWKRLVKDVHKEPPHRWAARAGGSAARRHRHTQSVPFHLQLRGTPLSCVSI